ncbi:MAG: hypothetical protein GY868_06725 [Deltaproteobacteria bacterium]|nr:hypothetical protein [Deltaproteobacteria bacterium]
MYTLLIYSRHCGEQRLERFLPPSAKRLKDRDVAVRTLDAHTASLTISLAGRLCGPCRIIPSLTAVTACEYGYRAVIGGSTMAGVAACAVGAWAGETVAEAGSRGQALTADVDTLSVSSLPEGAAITFHVWAADIDAFLASPLIVGLSVTTGGEHGNGVGHISGGPCEMRVAAKSQMVCAPELSRRICSPTCVSMVLDYFGRESDVPDVAALAYHAGHDLYGVWPANLWAASRYGVLGYVHRFVDFEDAARLLADKVPLIASICYDEGGLPGAAISRTSGHLVVVRGYDHENIYVNDPAAPEVKTVARSYPLPEFLGAWFGGKGVAYVLFPPAS